MIGRPIWVYDLSDPEEPVIYGSINYAMSVLSLSYGRLLSLIANRYLFGSLAISFGPLIISEVLGYKVEPFKDIQIRTVIHIYDSHGNLVTFKDAITHFLLDASLQRTLTLTGKSHVDILNRVATVSIL